MKIILIPILILASLACMTSGATPVPEAPKVTATPTQTAIPDPKAEPAAGAVFEIPTASSLCARVTASQSLHLRAQPNERARVLAYLHSGEQIRVIEFGKWWKISTDQGEGYANARYMELSECEK